jgi:anti-sigma regulatory factor (Ser/Thr protein kinase)
MPLQITEKIIENTLQAVLSKGVVGSYQDFTSWILLSLKLETKEDSTLNPDSVKIFLDSFKEQGIAAPGKFDKKEYSASTNFLNQFPMSEKDKFTVLGGSQFSPIQYVRSRQEFFLESNKVSEDDTMDISIATIEAIENAVKYGDGNRVELSQEIDSNRTYKLSIINYIKEFDLTDEIERGKYSSNITLMRGIMIMQKLFHHLDLQILNETKQVHLYAEKKLS